KALKPYCVVSIKRMRQNRKIAIKKIRVNQMPNNFTLEDYLTQESVNTTQIASRNPTLELTQNIKLNIKPLTPTLGLSNKNKEQEFENSIIEHIKSPETMKDISQVVGTPQANETEDQFVERSIK